jgi:lysophospholipase L1-like esterase
MDTNTASPEPAPPNRWCSTVATLLDVCFLVSLIAAALSWLLPPLSLEDWGIQFRISWGWKPITAPFLLLGLRLASVRFGARRPQTACGLWRRRGYGRAVVMILMPFLILLAVEGLLAAVDFEVDLPRIITREADGGRNYEETRGIIPDPELLHRFQPGAMFRGRRVNNLGFLDREVDPRKAPGTVRIICMGDSCSGQGPPPYSGTLNQLLIEQPPDSRTWEAFNMAVHGYSTSQGLRLYQLQTTFLEPDYVTLYYGWNDHWQAWSPDSNRMAVPLTPTQRWFLIRVMQRRFIQGLLHLMHPFRTPRLQRGEMCLRVPQQEYSHNLRLFADAIRSDGAEPVYVTAPRGETLAQVLVDKANTRSIEEGIALHDEYIELTRRAARENNVRLIDLAAIMDSKRNPEQFSGDGIHFTHEGLAEIARIFHEHFVRFAREERAEP